MPRQTDSNCLSYWFPKVKHLPGVPVPRTLTVEVDPVILLKKACSERLNVKEERALQGFRLRLQHAARMMGYPLFLRTGQGSGKHDWKDTCYVTKPDDLMNHVYRLVEWSECVDILGLPVRVWAVRELLPTKAAFKAFNDMPICQEFRCFGRDGKFLCLHPYWPEETIRQPDRKDWKERLRKISLPTRPVFRELRDKTRLVTKAIGGAWSVDWLWVEGRQRWYLTDMAVAADSYHWPGCKHADEVEDVGSGDVPSSRRQASRPKDHDAPGREGLSRLEDKVTHGR